MPGEEPRYAKDASESGAREAGPSQKADAANGVVVLLSGGLDSATTLHLALAKEYLVHAISFDYGQRHRIELESARRIAASAGVEHHVLSVDTSLFQNSALTDVSMQMPEDRDESAMSSEIPVTYVPGRNILFLSFAVSYCESRGFSRIFIGANAVDYSGYPDCRPDFIGAFQHMVELGTKAGVEGKPIHIETPLIDLKKSEIIALGMKLGVDYSLTSSCYQPDAKGKPCGRCDSCRLRALGFQEAGYIDPLTA
ncbi:MAG: 7-cyano-7-deazaguanine synthase QueC [Leptospiraceae bacterium]|nr:7-cyano-7-deazaguanine synthase QueC [Leptospiraceae bacterium]MCB1167796.1 7-cyano-7-deazaguanine synthase QueC [Leptospiraceae bacterium]